MKSSVYHVESSANQSSYAKRLAKIALGVFIMFICSQISIPLQPVPVTLQTVGVLIIGLTYKKSDAAYAVGAFLALGAIGIPVFSGFRGGMELFFLSTGGYLIGMLLGAYSIAYLQEKFGDDNMLKLLAYSTVGLTVIFALGLSWLAYLIGVEKAIQFGLMPFIIPGIVKCLFTASSVRLVKNFSKK